MNYDEKKLYMGIVEYYKSSQKILELHALYDDMDSEELMDLNLGRSILPYGEEELYYKKSLISFKELLMKSKINFRYINREDALKIMKYYDGYYFKLLRYRHIDSIEDLKNSKPQSRSRKK